MERRDSHRIKRRVPCEFDYDGHAYQGIVVDLSARGMFLQTDTAIEPGSDLVLRLRGELFSDLRMRGRVVRRRFTPAVLASMIRRGVGLRLLDVPAAYHEVLGIEPVEGDDVVWGAVEDWEPELGGDANAGPIALDIQVGDEEPPVLTPIAMATEQTADDGWSFEGDEAEDAEAKPEVPFAGEEGWESSSSEAAELAPAWPPQKLCRADALLIDQGELDDVYALLEALGADPVRSHSVDAHGFTGWEQPPRVVVAGARSALRLSVGPNVAAQGIVTIAVAETFSRTLCGMLRRQGFRYVVRRPVHPEALRLLLLRALFRGRDRREAPRVPFGCGIALRFHLRRKPATLLELSRSGCRVFVREWLEPDDRLSIRIPREVTGQSALTLPARVVRSERRRGVTPAQRVSLALRFDRLSDEERARLEALIAAHSLGPTRLRPRAAATRPGQRVVQVSGARPNGVGSAPQSPAESERRLGRRAWHRQEVLALDASLQRVRHALLGVDLSAEGLRVEPHPEIALGDRIQLFLYDAACTDRVLVDADVVRDDGQQGLLLRFRQPSEGTAREIARILERAPQIETSRDGSRGLVVAELLSSRAA